MTATSPVSRVNIAARVQSEAATSEVLVSETVRDLLLGTDFVFEDRGEYQLKGLERPRRLYAADWPAFGQAENSRSAPNHRRANDRGPSGRSPAMENLDVPASRSASPVATGHREPVQMADGGAQIHRTVRGERATTSSARRPGSPLAPPRARLPDGVPIPCGSKTTWTRLARCGHSVTAVAAGSDHRSGAYGGASPEGPYPVRLRSRGRWVSFVLAKPTGSGQGSTREYGGALAARRECRRRL
jgi:Adenylate and Guanylate cyclase catalytic domain